MIRKGRVRWVIKQDAAAAADFINQRAIWYRRLTRYPSLIVASVVRLTKLRNGTDVRRSRISEDQLERDADIYLQRRNAQIPQLRPFPTCSRPPHIAL
jgi:hypothetical protein